MLRNKLLALTTLVVMCVTLSINVYAAQVENRDAWTNNTMDANGNYIGADGKVHNVSLTEASADISGWQKDSQGWRYYLNSSGTDWYKNGWQWVDGNKDGSSECYYFGADGYIVTNGQTPDGYSVNADGQWTENGVVQKKSVAAQTDASANQSVGNTNANFNSYAMVDYLSRGFSAADKNYGICRVDSSRPAWKDGVTNVTLKNIEYCEPYQMGDPVGTKFGMIAPGGILYIRYNYDAYCAVAMNGEGYLLADTYTPDGYYVNKNGVIEIGGREVRHYGECCMVALNDASRAAIKDYNHVDTSKFRYQDWSRMLRGDMSLYPYGCFVYNHMRGFNRDVSGYESESFNEFGVCVPLKQRF